MSAKSIRSCLFAVLTLGLGAAPACDSKKGDDTKESGGAKAEGGEEAEAGGSENAKKVEAEVTEMKDKLGKGEDIKYACAGNLAMYEDLGKSSDDGEKKAYESMQAVCYVDMPKALIANLRQKIEGGEELGTMDTVNLETVLKDDKFPKDGEPAEVAADAKKLLEVEVPVFKLKVQLEAAKKEKEEGKTVSMGCIKAKQIVDKSGEAIGADEEAKAVLDAYKAACPEK
jgi:hypothetical protein